MSPNGRIQNCRGSPRTGSCCSAAAAAGLLLARVGLQLPLRWLVAAPRPLQLLQSSVCADTVWFKVLRKVGWDTALLSVPTDFLTIWWKARKQIPKTYRRGFDSGGSRLLVDLEGEESQNF